jgi:hypothetical protein
LAWTRAGAVGTLPVVEHFEAHWGAEYRWTLRAWQARCLRRQTVSEGRLIP